MPYQTIINSLESLPVLNSNSNTEEIKRIGEKVWVEANKLESYLTEIKRKRREVRRKRVGMLKTGGYFSAREQVVWARDECFLARSYVRLYTSECQGSEVEQIENHKERVLAVVRDIVSYQQRHVKDT